MRPKTFLPAAALALASAAAGLGARQEPKPEEGVAVRGAFANTRPGAGVREGKGERAAAASQPAKKPVEAAAVAGETPQPVGARKVSSVAEVATPSGIGVGYTLFMRAPTGEAVRVSNRREFKSGDSVRLLLETNTDGYLYIFNAENDAAPLMIFPNARLGRGANFIRAHVPYEIPSSAERDETLRWLSFDDRPAVERVYLVVARRPIEGVPAGEGLITWCVEVGEEVCAWSPSPEQWAGLKGAAGRAQVATSRATDEGRAETAAEHEAATRGLGLTADAPLPSVIYMITSADADILVATIDLIHK